MRKIKVAINGFGRIGRAFFKVARKRPELEVVAVNDLGDIENLVYLLKYDSVYGRADFRAEINSDYSGFTADGMLVKYFSEKEPSKLPWGELGIDVVVESTGLFTSYEKAKVHLEAGAKRVVISAPAKDEPKDELSSFAKGCTVLLGVNEENFDGAIITSNASCTTNAASPLIAILDEAVGIEKALLNTVHGYTASQSLVDAPNKKDWREGRAGAQNIIPSTTGAAIAVTKAFPKLLDLFDGISLRVPVVAGSIVDITFLAKKNTTKEEVNAALKVAAAEEKWKGIFAVTEEELVSSDIVGSRYASIADLKFTRVVGGNLVKVLGWYDNEMGYAYTLVEHVVKFGNQI